MTTVCESINDSHDSGANMYVGSSSPTRAIQYANTLTCNYFVNPSATWFEKRWQQSVAAAAHSAPALKKSKGKRARTSEHLETEPGKMPLDVSRIAGLAQIDDTIAADVAAVAHFLSLITSQDSKRGVFDVPVHFSSGNTVLFHVPHIPLLAACLGVILQEVLWFKSCVRVSLVALGEWYASAVHKPSESFVRRWMDGKVLVSKLCFIRSGASASLQSVLRFADTNHQQSPIQQEARSETYRAVIAMMEAVCKKMPAPQEQIKSALMVHVDDHPFQKLWKMCFQKLVYLAACGPPSAQKAAASAENDFYVILDQSLKTSMSVCERVFSLVESTSTCDQTNQNHKDAVNPKADKIAGIVFSALAAEIGFVCLFIGLREQCSVYFSAATLSEAFCRESSLVLREFFDAAVLACLFVRRHDRHVALLDAVESISMLEPGATFPQHPLPPQIMSEDVRRSSDVVFEGDSVAGTVVEGCQGSTESKKPELSSKNISCKLFLQSFLVVDDFLLSMEGLREE